VVALREFDARRAKEAAGVVERSQARTEVVPREAAAATAQPGGEGPGLLDVGDRRLFGQLEYRLAGADPGRRQLGLDERRELPVDDRPARQVGMEHQPASGARVLSDQPERLAHHPAVDGLNQSGTPGAIQEGAGRARRAPVLDRAPRRQLVLADPAAREVEHRLAEEDQALLAITEKED
jgi:hypothetical protein